MEWEKDLRCGKGHFGKGTASLYHSKSGKGLGLLEGLCAWAMGNGVTSIHMFSSAGKKNSRDRLSSRDFPGEPKGGPSTVGRNRQNPVTM